MKKIVYNFAAFLSITLSCFCFNPNASKTNAELKKTTINLDTLPAIRSIVNGLAKGNRVESQFIGEGSMPSEQWVKYEQLLKIATTGQLIVLTDHGSPTVRCYAFQALATRHSPKVFTILRKHLIDTAKVEALKGCIGWREFTGDYFVNLVTAEPITGLYQLNRTEKKSLDSILLNDKLVVLSARSSLLDTLKPTSVDYERVKRLVLNERNDIALRFLAKYQKQTDKELIASFFKEKNNQFSALNAVSDFPDPYFYPYVLKVFEQEWKEKLHDYQKWSICYQVLALYPKPETLALFDRTVKSTDRFRYQTLCSNLLAAISRYPNKLYDPIKAKIKLDNYHLDEVKEELEREK